ncbi:MULTISPECIES: hypothetical protein [Xenorhabdus]|uniref:hypothetical protein n=1 Tax=Xenorhabdus TaxID=626 RepID=UPI00069C7DD0|nr:MULTISPECIES: hypothetical protein [Xenorhabdus]WFQ78849.1 hypothetical protein PXH59_14490 [Xenorhabdus sp. SF857]WFQ80028.1 hypothetical protein PXH59_02225 [Xenorhabdus sp. SF857]WFQ80906.1 hypothetical protein PXH59_07350 [Xenorhabdus sp. SF857]
MNQLLKHHCTAQSACSVPAATLPAGKMIKLFEGDISGEYHCGNPVSIHYPLLPSIPGLHHRQPQTKEIHSTEQRQQTPLCQLADVLDRHCQKVQPFFESPGQKDEYLSVALPECPDHPIRIYGAGVNADMRFLMRAELVLSILRKVSSRMECTTSIAEQDAFDALFWAANDVLCGMPLRQEKRRKRRTSRGLIKTLLRLEERLHRIRS